MGLLHRGAEIDFMSLPEVKDNTENDLVHYRLRHKIVKPASEMRDCMRTKSMGSSNMAFLASLARFPMDRTISHVA